MCQRQPATGHTSFTLSQHGLTAMPSGGTHALLLLGNGQFDDRTGLSPKQEFCSDGIELTSMLSTLIADSSGM